MKNISIALSSLLLIGLLSVAGNVSAHDSNTVQVDNGSNHIYVFNNDDEHIVKVDAGNDNHICVVHDEDGKIVEVSNHSNHLLINTHGTGEDTDDCQTSAIHVTPTPTPTICPCHFHSPTPEPTHTPEPTPTPQPSQTPEPTHTPAPTTTPTAIETPTPAPTQSPSATPTSNPDPSSNPSSDPGDGGDILSASTMAPTGDSVSNLSIALMILGAGIISIRGLMFLKARKLFLNTQH